MARSNNPPPRPKVRCGCNGGKVPVDSYGPKGEWYREWVTCLACGGSGQRDQ